MRKSKKGLSFILLMSVFTFVAFLMANILLISPARSSVDDIEFGEQLKKSSLTQAKLPAEEFYLQNVVDTEIEEVKNYFSKQNILQSGGSSCVSTNSEYWYDESQGSINSTDSQGNTIIKNKCLPNFDSTLLQKLYGEIESEIKSELEDSKDKRGVTDTSISLELGQDLGADINLQSLYKIETSTSTSTIPLSFTQKISLESYAKTLENIVTNLPNVPIELSNEVQICLEGNSNKTKDICIEEIVKKRLDLNSNVSDFSTRVDYLNTFSDKDYFVLDIGIVNQKTKNLEFSFRIKLENSIPFELVGFNVENSLRNNNVLKVSINKPVDTTNLHGFIILYSYENFFDESSYGKEKYDNLIQLLKDRQVPPKFSPRVSHFEGRTGKKIDESSHTIFHSYSNLNLNALYIPWENQQKVETFITQNFNSVSNKYEILENIPVHVFVFAVDKQFNYYINPELFKQRIQSKTPQINFGPSGLEKNKVTLEAQRQGFDSTLFIDIKDYDDEFFSYYDLYVIKKQDELSLKPRCEGASVPCFYYNGNGKLTSKDSKIALTSSQLSNEQKNQISEYEIIQTTIFPLESLEEYIVQIIPIGVTGIGITKTELKQFEFVESSIGPQGDETNYLKAVQVDKREEPFKEKFVPLDQTPPDPMTSIQVSQGLIQVNQEGVEVLYIQWSPLEAGIEKINVLVEVYDSTGTTKIDSIPKFITLDNTKVIDLDSSIGKVEVKPIIPIDSSGNQVGNPQAYQGQTQSAFWTRVS